MAGRALQLPSDTSKYPLMRADQAAAYLGMSKSTFRRRVIVFGIIAHLTERVTGRRRFRREDLDSYIADAYDYHTPKGTQTPADGRTALSAARARAKAGKR